MIYATLTLRIVYDEVDENILGSPPLDQIVAIQEACKSAVNGIVEMKMLAPSGLIIKELVPEIAVGSFKQKHWSGCHRPDGFCSDTCNCWCHCKE